MTLSACQTALGKLVTGEGMVGLTQAFFFAGASSVVASLWNVNDEATARFMSLFYGHLGDGLSRAEALRLARVDLRRDERYRHPYYWAPYILLGEAQKGVTFPAGQDRVWLILGVILLLSISIYFIRKGFAAQPPCTQNLEPRTDSKLRPLRFQNRPSLLIQGLDAPAVAVPGNQFPL